MTLTVPLDERRILDTLPIDRDSIYHAWQYGRLYGRYESSNAILNLQSVFGARDDQTITCGDSRDIIGEAIGELRRGDST